MEKTSAVGRIRLGLPLDETAISRDQADSDRVR
jgi:hypothetical protein